ncbi:hypothetical protein [Actinokineospora spheciospongiae]|uniref:hypothetical protein n=1 Tax=Actinokineospora spheciospongiae TaxID=909613 RepID=UPI0004BB34BF|nr:hypothetical protein [Actinokineospora spheciospongiae]
MTTPDAATLAARIDDAAEIGAFNGWNDAELMTRYGASFPVPTDPPTLPLRYHAHPEVAAAYTAAYREQFAEFLDDRAKY